MAEYCVYCGNELVDGKCSCPMFKAAEVEQAEAAKLHEENEKRELAEKAAEQAEIDKAAALERAEADRRAEEEWEAAKIAEREALNNNAQETRASFESAAAAGSAESHKENADSGNKFGVNFDKVNSDEVKNILTSTVKLAPEFIKRPYSLISEALKGNHRNEGLIIGGATLLLIFLTCTMHLPVAGLSAFIGIGYRALFGFLTALLFAILTAALSAGIFFFADKSEEKVEFLNVVGAFSLLLLPVGAATVLTFIFGFFLPSIAMLIMGIVYLFYNLLSLILVYENVKGDNDGRIWRTLLVYTLVMIIVSLSFSIISNIVMQQAMSGLSGMMGMGGMSMGGMW